jgi:hypothetical protein
MKGMFRVIESKLINFNLKPVKVVTLKTGLVCKQYNNGKIEVI